MSKYGLKRELIGKLRRGYIQYVQNPGAAETVGVLYWKLCWWGAAKKLMKDVSRIGWIGGEQNILP